MANSHSLFGPTSDRENVKVEIKKEDKINRDDDAETRAIKIINYLRRYIQADNAWREKFAKVNLERYVDEQLADRPLSQEQEILKGRLVQMQKEAQEALKNFEARRKQEIIQQIPPEKLKEITTELPGELQAYIKAREAVRGTSDRYNLPSTKDTYCFMAMIAYQKLSEHSLNLSQDDARKEFAAIRAGL